jgi:hypothetical protein
LLPDQIRFRGIDDHDEEISPVMGSSTRFLAPLVTAVAHPRWQ